MFCDLSPSTEVPSPKADQKPEEPSNESIAKTLPFVVSAGKKIKTLLPKRSPVENSGEVIPAPSIPTIPTPEPSAPVPSMSLSAIYPIGTLFC